MSQYGEHAPILQHFAGRKGRFLDIGAYDGVQFSNTWPLVDQGWSGVLLEPSPWVFQYLVKNYQGKPGFEFVNASLAPVSGLTRWWDSGGDALSTMVAAHKDSFAARGYPYLPMWVASIDWAELLFRFPGPYQFLNIDAEGISSTLLEIAPLEKIKAEMICVEVDGLCEMTADFLREHGYKKQQLIGANLLVSK